ncbi:lipoprotein, partial [Metamycoplasma alkalescens]
MKKKILNKLLVITSLVIPSSFLVGCQTKMNNIIDDKSINDDKPINDNKEKNDPDINNQINNNEKNDIDNEKKDNLVSNSLSLADLRSISNKNEYPSYVNKFKKIDQEVLYSEIYDRSFSIKFGTKTKNGEFLSNGSGTGWLLDYHQYTNNPNKYKLFFATNLHVLGHFSNSLDDKLNEDLNYNDPSEDKVVGVAIGKSKLKPQSFQPIRNSETNAISQKNDW